MEKVLLIDFLIDHHREFGAEVKFVSEATTEGAQFTRGFGGLGAFLRYKVDFQDFTPCSDDEDIYSE